MLIELFKQFFIGVNADLDKPSEVRRQPFGCRFTDNGDGTVTDKKPGLMWQQEDDNVERNWKEAMAYCEGLKLAGHTDWRLPSKKELEIIVDKSRENPAINTDFFPSTKSSYYWSSSTYAFFTIYA